MTLSCCHAKRKSLLSTEMDRSIWIQCKIKRKRKKTLPIMYTSIYWKKFRMAFTQATATMPVAYFKLDPPQSVPFHVKLEREKQWLDT